MSPPSRRSFAKRSRSTDLASRNLRGKRSRKKVSAGRASPPRRRQPTDREGRRRCPRAGLHRGDAGLETRRRAPPRRAHRAHRSRRAQGRQMELALLRSRGPGLVPQRPLLHEVRQGGVLPRHVAASCPPRRRPSRRKSATSTSTKTSSTKCRWRRGSGRRPPFPTGTADPALSGCSVGRGVRERCNRPIRRRSRERLARTSSACGVKRRG